MKIVRGGAAPLTSSSDPIFEGSVETRTLVDEHIGDHLRVTAVRFNSGARTRLHTHECEQVLYVTDGRGILATESEQYQVLPGDVVVVPAGERHWHGGTPDSPMTHLSILTPGRTTF